MVVEYCEVEAGRRMIGVTGELQVGHSFGGVTVRVFCIEVGVVVVVIVVQVLVQACC